METENKFLGAVHSRDYRRPECTNYGQGTTETNLNINLLADRSQEQFCGVFVNKVMTGQGCLGSSWVNIVKYFMKEEGNFWEDFNLSIYSFKFLFKVPTSLKLSKNG